MQAERQRDLMLRSRRAMSWLQPGLVVKRWLLTSGIGLVLALLGAAVWADLQPIYWMLWVIQEALGWITRVLPGAFTGPLVLLLGVGLLLWGQSQSFGSIQQALAPEKDTVLVDALRAKSRLNRGPQHCRDWGWDRPINVAKWTEALQQPHHRDRDRCR